MLLKVRNFMCYGDDVEPLMFDGIQLACLSGENGNGKSALLDAITWVLWGKARASDAELIHAGASEMEVDFEFGIGSQRYRVIRKSMQKGKHTTSDCQFQLDDQGLYRTITGSSLRDTNRLITDTLHMSYDTFINSAFLLQGRADEFTRQTPSKRKEILAEILQLNRFEAWEANAKDRSKEARALGEDLRRKIGIIDGELAKLPEYERELVTNQQSLDEATSRRRQNQEQLNRLAVEAKALQEKVKLADDLEGRLSELLAELQALQRRIEGRKQKIAQANLVLARRNEIECGYQELLDRREQESELNEMLSRVSALRLRSTELIRTIDSARNDLETQQKVASSKIYSVQERIAKLPAWQQEYALTQNENAELERLDSRRAELQEARHGLVNKRDVHKKINEQLKPEADSIKERIAILKKNGEQAVCPVCKSELSQQASRDLVAQFEEQLRQMRTDYRANEQCWKQCEEDMRAIDQQLGDLEKRLRHKITIERRLTQLETQIDAACQEQEQLATQAALLEQLTASLRGKQYAEREQAELRDLEQQIAECKYDDGRHAQIRQQVKLLVPYEAQHQELFNAFSTLQNEQENLAHEQAQVAGKERQVDDERRRIKGLRDQAAGLPRLTGLINVAQTAIEEAEHVWRQANDLVGYLNQKINYCKSISVERVAIQSDLDRANEDQKYYDELAVAFGKKGVPAMLIESVLPELEQEANTLLGRMTDNRMTVRFETQRSAKASDSVIETLEIKIHDGASTRNYELFSGGESFRINFAIRIALSKLLARRSGASLQTLIIDEGFGTQDAAGRERLVAAISSIQPDFEKILVITHIQELKDEFPVIINITRGPNGSHISVN